MNPQKPNKSPAFPLQEDSHMSNTDAKKIIEANHNKCDTYLNRLYVSHSCQFFYIFLIVMSTILIAWTYIEGSKLPESNLFVLLENLITLIIVIDFVCRVRLIGWRKFWKSGWNIFDSIVVLVCVTSSILWYYSNSEQKLFEELSEEIVFAVRNIFQYLRLVMFIKYQKRTQATVAQIIDFSHLSEEHHDDMMLNSDRRYYVTNDPKNSGNGAQNNERYNHNMEIVVDDSGFEKSPTMIPRVNQTTEMESSDNGRDKIVQRAMMKAKLKKGMGSSNKDR